MREQQMIGVCHHKARASESVVPGSKLALISSVRTSLAHASLPPSFWHHALQMTTYLFNILPHKLLNYKSPLRVFYHKDPTYSYLRILGCLCYPLFPSTIINKLQPALLHVFFWDILRITVIINTMTYLLRK